MLSLQPQRILNTESNNIKMVIIKENWTGISLERKQAITQGLKTEKLL